MSTPAESIRWAAAVLSGEAEIPVAADLEDLDERMTNRLWAALRTALETQSPELLGLARSGFLDDRRPELAAEALAALVMAGDPDAISRALTIIAERKEHLFVLVRAIEALGAARPGALLAVRDSLRALEQHPSATVKKAAASALLAC